MTRGALSGRTAIVASAGRGIGRGAAATSCALSRAGASVVLAARDGQALAALAADLGAAGGQAVAVPTDLASPVSVRRLVEQTLGAFGRLDAACNDIAGCDAAASCAAARCGAGSCGAAGRDCAVQVRGLSLVLKYEIQAMRRSGGCIVNLVPSSGPQAALIELTREAALDLAGSGVRINAVATGPPAGPRVGPPAGSVAGLPAGAGVGLGGGAEGVARAVLWLCSDAASPITGKALYVRSGPCCDSGRLPCGSSDHAGGTLGRRGGVPGR
ncbi:SDR family NAD(P)-dependent oxidoreductase [Nonomuraea diastatica]|uniref:SDR family oxidoreductase n=1 Tax=Nonomuraea diastatica TaxID=1848329 RepID=A0A4R4WU75_9ACTN|nr:SDR family oxidoreductase [Nonomuraea diastatica]TDD21165.1 SDR family oxidoreductase [Nonomuraea diastatica]